jgi:predicted transcriptional regulator
MKGNQVTLNPLDIAVLLKIASINNSSWQQKPLAEALQLSQSEISKSVARSKFAGLLDLTGKK